MNLRSFVRGVAPAAVVLASLVSAAQAGEQRHSDVQTSGKPSLTGSWTETTTIPGGPPFAGLLTFGADGTLVTSYQGTVILAGPSAGTYSSGHGSWVHERGRTFSTTTVQVASGFDGTLLYVITIRQRVRLDQSRDGYHSAVRAEFSDAAGNLLFALEGTTVGRRIAIDRLP
jgi:hypothetical protein